MVSGIHHIALIVSCEEAVLFYERLGFKRIKTIKRGYDTVIILNGGASELELFIDGSHPKNTSGVELLGLRHIAFNVGNLDEFLTEHGFGNAEKCRDWNDEVIAFIRDFDGNVIELRK